MTFIFKTEAYSKICTIDLSLNNYKYIESYILLCPNIFELSDSIKLIYVLFSMRTSQVQQVLSTIISEKE